MSLKDEIGEKFGIKIGQIVRGKAIHGAPEIEGEVISLVVPAEGDPFVVILDGRRTDKKLLRSHHRALGDIEAVA